MLESIKRFFKVYPLPIFIIVLSFTIYYFVFEVIRDQDTKKNLAITEEESRKADTIANADKEDLDTKIVVDKTNIKDKKEISLQEKLEKKVLEEGKEEELKRAVANVRILNVREMPWAQSKLLAKLEFGQESVLLDEKEGWLLLGELHSKEPIGWVAKRFVKIIKDENKIENEEAQETQKIQDFEQKLITSRVSSLNIRKEASQEGQVIGKLTPKLTAYILEENPQGWVLIGDAEGKRALGWVLKSYVIEVASNKNEVKRIAKEANEPKESDKKIYTSRVASLNIRSINSTDGRILGKLTPQNRVEILGIKDGWAKIKDLNTQGEGWVLERSLKEF